MPINANPQFEAPSIFSDLGSLDTIRQQGLVDQKGAIKQAAREFEAFFMNMMLKSMRQASEVIGENPLTGSSAEKMFIGMMDEQMSVDLSHQGHLGIAELMISQLSGHSHVLNLADPNQSAAKPTLDQYRAAPIPSATQSRSNQVQSASNNKSPEAAKQSPLLEIPTKVSLATLAVENQDKLLNELNELVTKTIFPKTSVPKNIVDKNSLVKIGPPINHIPENANSTRISAANENLTKVTPEKKSLFEKISDFVTTLLPLAEKAAQKLQLDPKVLIAQAALETGWGKFIMHDETGEPGFNLFGIKAGHDWQGESIRVDTLEFDNQTFKKINAAFRKYSDFSESFNDYVDFLQQNPRYQNALNATGDPQQYIEQLQSSGYATDPDYAQKIMRIFSDKLFQTIETNPH